MAPLDGRAVRLTANNGGFWPGQWLKTVCELFQRNAAASVSNLGWGELFRTYDTDGAAAGC